MQSSAIIPNAKELKRNKSCEKCKSECAAAAAAALPFTTKLHVVLVFTIFFFLPNENMISCQERTHLLLLYEELELEKNPILRVSTFYIIEYRVCSFLPFFSII